MAQYQVDYGEIRHGKCAARLHGVVDGISEDDIEIRHRELERGINPEVKVKSDMGGVV